MFGLSSQLHIYTTFPQTRGPTTDTTQCNIIATCGLLTKKSSTLPLTFHFSDSPFFLSNFFVYQNFPLFSVSFSTFSISPLFHLYLGVGWVSRWRSGLRLGFWGWVTVEIKLWVMVWLELVGARLRWRSCYGSQRGLNRFVMDRRWVGVLMVWIGVGLVFRWCGSALGLLWWCRGGARFVVVVRWWHWVGVVVLWCRWVCCGGVEKEKQVNLQQ